MRSVRISCGKGHPGYAEYSTIGETEEYVDIISVLEDLFIDAEASLKPIKGIQFESA